MNMSRLKKVLMRHEGPGPMRDTATGPVHLAYTCPGGALTIGYGRNLDSKGITEEEAERLLFTDIRDAIVDLNAILPDYQDHEPQRQEALVSWVFNLGRSRASLFKRFLTAMRAHDYEQAAKELEDSRWYVQVGTRAHEIVHIIRHGEYPGRI